MDKGCSNEECKVLITLDKLRKKVSQYTRLEWGNMSGKEMLPISDTFEIRRWLIGD
jgi:hypothetical protein